MATIPEQLAVYRDLAPGELAAYLETDPTGSERLAAYQAMDGRIAALPAPEPEWWLRTNIYQALRAQSSPRSRFPNPSVTAGQLASVLIVVLLIIAAWSLFRPQFPTVENPTPAATAVPALHPPTANTVNPAPTATAVPDLHSPTATAPPTSATRFACPISPIEQIFAGTGPTMAGAFPVWMASRGQETVPLLSIASGVPEQISEGDWSPTLLLVDAQFSDPLLITGERLDGEGKVYFLRQPADDTVIWEPQHVLPMANSSEIEGNPLGRVQHLIAWGVTAPGCYELTFSLAQYAPKIVIEVLPPPLITPTPTPDPQPVQLRLDSWSPWPNSQYVAYWQYTAADLERSASPSGPFPPGRLTFYNTSSGGICSLPAAFRYDGATFPRHAWRSDGNFLLFYGRNLRVLPDPCHQSHTNLTNVFPEPIQEVAAVHRFQAFYLLRGQSQYWLYYPFAAQSLQLLPVVGVAPHGLNAYAISPQGRYVGINLWDGGTAIVETATGQVITTTAWSPLDEVDIRPPVWLDETIYLIPQTTKGPLLATLEGHTQPVAVLFDLLPSSHQIARGVPTGFQQYAILFQDFSGSANDAQVWLYHSATGEVETLPFTFTSGEFDANGRWLLLHKEQENDSGSQYELWLRAIEPAGMPPTPLTSSESSIHWTGGPRPGGGLVRLSQLLTLSSGNQVLIVSAEGEIQAQTFPGHITGTPLRSPDGNHLAIVIQSISGQEEVVVLPIE